MRAVAIAGAAAALLVALAPAASSHRSACTARYGGALPDAACTPGALNPAVTQGDLASTICHSGWAASVRPPLAVTEPEKFKSMRAYGIPTTAGHAGLYEFDHLVPIELGGAVDDPANLWPEPHSASWRGKQVGSFVKDAAENRVNAEVCSGRVTLAAAQAVFERDWRKAP